MSGRARREEVVCVLISTDPLTKTLRIARRIRDTVEGIEEIYVAPLPSPWDIVVKLRASSYDELKSIVDRIRLMEGVRSTLVIALYSLDEPMPTYTWVDLE